ncbi:MAG: hypothetical protein NC212_06330 [Staphylococcus sp.]|nr:hypothetical protein [Staphylococcus sp.]
MKSIYQLAFAALAVCLPLTACSDDDDYVPGEVAPADCPSVYFPMQSTYSHTFTSDETRKTFDLTVCRLEAGEAISVPVTITSDVEGFSGAATVDFAAGEKTAIYTVDCADIPVQSEYAVTVSIPDDYANPYAEGTAAVTVKSLIADWELWAENAEFTFSNYYSPIHTNIYAMRGTRRLKFENFLGSGLDLQVEVEDIDKDVTSYARMYPLNNADPYVNYYPQDAFECWYFYDQATGNWPQWSPDGTSTPQIEFALCYGYDASSNYKYTYILPDYNSGSFTFELSYTDGSSAYDYINFSYGEPLFPMF